MRFWTFEDVPLNSPPRKRFLSIHWRGSRGHSLLSPIRSYTFPVIVPTSAHLGHYAEPLLLGRSHSTRACAVNSSASQCLEDLTCDGVVTGIQIRARAGDIVAYRSIKNLNKTAMAATCFN
jgi:hypothetical protein